MVFPFLRSIATTKDDKYYLEFFSRAARLNVNVWLFVADVLKLVNWHIIIVRKFFQIIVNVDTRLHKITQLY